MSPDLCIYAKGLRKSYDRIEALRGIDLEVRRGEIFGLLGQNGAGKTTAIEILEGLRPRSSGEVNVLGLDPGKQARALKEKIGVCLQETNLPDKIRVNEAIELFAAQFYRRTDPQKILSRVGLISKQKCFYSALSGGQKQRLALGLSLVGEPELLFLDEPTVGLDAQMRREIHDLILEIRAEGATIVLTTHYIEEAQRLCHRVAIIDHGKIVDSGTPAEIQNRVVGHSLIKATFDRPCRELPNPLKSWLMADTNSDLEKMFCVPDLAESMVELVRWCDRAQYKLVDIAVEKANLEDAFLRLTGHHIEGVN